MWYMMPWPLHCKIKEEPIRHEEMEISQSISNSNPDGANAAMSYSVLAARQYVNLMVGNVHT